VGQNAQPVKRTKLHTEQAADELWALTEGVFERAAAKVAAES